MFDDDDLSVPATQEELSEAAKNPNAFVVIVGEIGNEQGRIEGVCYTETSALRLLNNSMFNGSWGKIDNCGQTIVRRTR